MPAEADLDSRGSIGNRREPMPQLHSAPIPADAMVIPGGRLPPIGMAMEQGRRRSLGPRSDVEMRWHATSGMIAHRVLCNRRDLDPIAVHDGQSQVGEPEDLDQQREIDSPRCRLETGDARRLDPERGRQVALAQVAPPPHAHDDARHVDGGSFPAATSLVAVTTLAPAPRTVLVHGASLPDAADSRTDRLTGGCICPSRTASACSSRATPTLLRFSTQCRSVRGADGSGWAFGAGCGGRHGFRHGRA